MLDFRKELNGPQLDAVTTIDGPLLIIAGAGSGKTRVITFRMAHMLDSGIPQSAILALTFTNKAAKEMAARIKELTGKKLPKLTVSTFHAFGVKVLRERIGLLGFRENFSIYDQTDQYELIKESGRELGFTRDALDVYKVAELFSSIKTGRRTWECANDQYQKLYDEYQSSLKVFNAVDFDDLIALPIKILEENPEIRAEYRDRYRYILVDEFQDTSLQQYKLMSLLADRNVCVVGDDDQSIYSWRGANYENLLRFEKDYPGGKEIKLEQNYRSTGTILEAANGLIRNNTNRKDKKLWSGGAEGKPIELYYPETEMAEAEFIASEIKSLSFSEGLRYDQFGVLLRTNALARHLEEALLAEQVPYRVSGGTSFFERKEIKDVISYLRVIMNPDDDVNLLRIVNSPRRGIGKKTLEVVNSVAAARKGSIHESMDAICKSDEQVLSDKTKAEIDAFLSLLSYYREQMVGKKGFVGKLRLLLEQIDYWGYLVAEHKDEDKVAKWKFLNIQLLLDSIEKWEKDPDTEDPSLFTWLHRVSLVNRDDLDDEGNKGKVNLMTIHASKGLEFDVVFIAGCEDGVIPHARSVEEGGGSLEEERRLFYVAITRAREKLIITACQKRRNLNQYRECQPSPFLQEIPQGLIDFRDAPAQAEPEDIAESFKKIKAILKF